MCSTQEQDRTRQDRMGRFGLQTPRDGTGTGRLSTQLYLSNTEACVRALCSVCHRQRCISKHARAPHLCPPEPCPDLTSRLSLSAIRIDCASPKPPTGKLPHSVTILDLSACSHAPTSSYTSSRILYSSCCIAATLFCPQTSPIYTVCKYVVCIAKCSVL